MITLDYKAIGARAKEKREQSGLSLDQVAEQLQISVQDLTNFEEHGAELAARVLITLATEVLHCQIAELLHGPYPYRTQTEWMDAYLAGKITEGTLAYGLKVDRLEARRLVQEYQQGGEVTGC